MARVSHLKIKMAEAEKPDIVDLSEALSKALGDIGISRVADDAAYILRFAACLSPDDAQAPISTTRLFEGVVALGKATRANGPLESYAVALVEAIEQDPSLNDSYYSNVNRLFTTESDAAALQRLRPRWFSENVVKILNIAFGDFGRLNGDAIVRVLLKYGSGLIYGRLPMTAVAAAVERLRNPKDNERGASQSSERIDVDAALVRLSIQAIDDLRHRIVRAAAFRSFPEQIRPVHMLRALLDFGQEDRHSTDPSKMLSDSLTAEAAFQLRSLPTPTPPNYDAEGLINLAPSSQALLRRAFDKQRSVFLNERVGAKGMVAAFLTIRPEEVADDSVFGSLNIAAQRTQFWAVVRERLVDRPQELRQWSQALEFEIASPPKLNNDQPWSGQSRDHLGITNDALAIANVAAGTNTNLPLAFGIFGDWGSGKTFFMRLIYDQIAQLAGSGAEGDGFEHAIVQIQFNAWHYAETNLWASLVEHIFDELDRWLTRNQKGTGPSEADAILSRLATSRQLALETATELVQRRKEHKNAGAALAEAQENLSKAEEGAARAPVVVWRAAAKVASDDVAADPDLKKYLGDLGVALGIPALLDDTVKLRATLDSVNRSASAGNAALAALRSTAGSRCTMLLAVAALLLVPAALFGLRQLLAQWLHWDGFADIGRGLEALGGFLAMALVLARNFAARITSITDKFTKLRSHIDEQIRQATAEEADALAAASREVAKQSAAVEQARVLLQATGDQVAAALRDYAEESGGLRIRRFVRARAGNDGYGRHLGLVSTIRKDFEQLESMMLDADKPDPRLEEARSHYETRVNALIEEANMADGALLPDEIKELQNSTKSLRDVDLSAIKKFRRIVLYVDDLDRCEPEKVVQVLQAVNMLLSFRLFVVMVAVDARWLARSLETKYPDFFGVTIDQGNDGSEKRSQLKNGATRRATPADYLEKIFQVPYWVPRMNKKTSAALVSDLVASDRRIAGLGPGPNGDPHKSEQPPPPVKATAEDEQSPTHPQQPTALGLTEEEIKALAALSPYLGGSPRRARRYVNVYRVAKASLTPGELKKLEDGEFRALATQLAIATGAPNAFSGWVDICNKPTAPKTSIKMRLEALTLQDDERANFDGAIERFEAMCEPGANVLEKLRAQADLAARFSFVIPPETSEQEG